MRQVALDTETTGLDVKLGNRVIEVAAVEIVNRQLSGVYFHRYVNAGRDSEPGALEVHGLTTEFLADKPRFPEIARDLVGFIDGAELIIHNAAFDIEFLNAELALAGLEPLTRYCGPVIDSLLLARELRPGKRNNLDALCEAYAIDRSGRVRHGALIDTRLLAQVYLAMTRGQDRLVIDAAPADRLAAGSDAVLSTLSLPVILADADEAAAHEARLDAIDKAARGVSLWRQAGAAAGEGTASAGTSAATST
ncbi:MAG: DNA polymerase III subunit epsilon [bacterium]|nr:DNA polymerase III subunit epsilon [Betaproteobacteria bacterium]